MIGCPNHLPTLQSIEIKGILSLVSMLFLFPVFNPLCSHSLYNRPMIYESKMNAYQTMLKKLEVSVSEWYDGSSFK